MAWTQNLQHGTSLPADPSLLHAVVLCCSLAVLWQNEAAPRRDAKYYSGLAVLMHGLAICIGTFALLTVYRVSFAISGVFFLLSLHQLVAPVKLGQEVEQALAVSEDLETEVAHGQMADGD